MYTQKRRFSVYFFVVALIGSVNLLICPGWEASAQTNVDERITYAVISQRLLTNDEIKKFEDVKGYQIAIKVRLTNDSDRSIDYLSSSVHSRPLGYRWERKTGTTSWSYTPSKRGRNGKRATEFFGIGYEWRELSPHSSVEGEILSYTSSDEEFAFSTFIRDSAKKNDREIVTAVIRPLSNP